MFCICCKNIIGECQYVFCICFFHIIQCSSREGEEDGELYQGDLKLTGAGDFWGGARGYQGALELTDDFGILIRVNSPAPVTFGEE